MHRTKVIAPLLVAAVLSLGGMVASAQDATPAASPDVPDPAECRVEPRPVDDLALLTGTPIAAEATPVPLAGGEPADRETVAAVTATIREYYACLNAGDPLRLFALFSDGGLRRFAAEYGAPIPGDAASAATPVPVPPDERFFARAIRDVRDQGDGRVVATVIESNLPLEATGEFDDDALPPVVFVVAAADGRYLIEDVVPAGAEGTPTP